jgi:hypothetical protein
MDGRLPKIKASEVKPDSVYTDNSGTNWMVRDVARLVESPGRTALLLSAGRTDPGEWHEFMDDEELAVYEPFRIRGKT